jgi:hypothetical protein
METVEKNSIEIISKLEYNDFKKYWIFCLFKGKYYKFGPILFWIICITGILIVTSSGLTFGFETSDIFAVAFFIVFMLLMAYLMYLSPKLYYKSATILRESISKYNFGEEYMTIESVSNSTNGFSQIRYENLFKVYESDEYLFILISNKQSFIIRKNNNSADDIEATRKILQSNVKKYVNYSK